MPRVKDYFLNHGVKPIDIPIAIGLFKLTAYGTWFAATAVCIRYRPIRYFFRSGVPRTALEKTRRKIPNLWRRMENGVLHTADRVAEWRITQNLLGRLAEVRRRRSESQARYRARARRNLGMGIAEGVLLYKTTFPIWAPLYFFLILRYYSNKNLQDYEPIEHVSASLSYGDVVTPERIIDFKWLREVIGPNGSRRDAVDTT